METSDFEEFLDVALPVLAAMACIALALRPSSGCLLRLLMSITGPFLLFLVVGQAVCLSKGHPLCSFYFEFDRFYNSN